MNAPPSNGYLRPGYSENYLLRSKAAKEIISQKNDFMTKWALSLFLLVLLVLFVCTWFVKYPDTIKADATVFAQHDRYYATMILSKSASEKISAGQKVQLSFDGYRYQEFGFVEGRLADFSFDPSGKYCHVRVDLPRGLITNYGKKILYINGLQSGAIIITGNIRLLKRCLGAFKR